MHSDEIQIMPILCILSFFLVIFFFWGQFLLLPAWSILGKRFFTIVSLTKLSVIWSIKQDCQAVLKLHCMQWSLMTLVQVTGRKYGRPQLFTLSWTGPDYHFKCLSEESSYRLLHCTLLKRRNKRYTTSFDFANVLYIVLGTRMTWYRKQK